MILKIIDEDVKEFEENRKVDMDLLVVLASVRSQEFRDR